jgi:hypothetical protein
VGDSEEAAADYRGADGVTKDRERSTSTSLELGAPAPRRRLWHFGSRRFGDIAADKEAALRRDIERGEVDFKDLVVLKYWQTAPDRGRPDARQLKRLGERYYDRALQTWKDTNRGRVVVFSIAGAYLLPDGTFKYTLLGTGIEFDWDEAQRLVYEIDAVAEQAREWWTVAPTDAGTTQARSKWRDRRAAKADKKRIAYETRERQPHLDRAFAVLTAILSATQFENSVHQASRRLQPLRRGHAMLTAVFSALEPDIRPTVAPLVRTLEPSRVFEKKMELLRSEVDRARALLEVAAQRNAQVRYGRGMVYGALLLAVLVAAIAVVLAQNDVSFEYAIALPAGGLGALVSVLQRMTSGSLELDFNAGKRMLTAFGAVRPLIGGVFGMALFAFLKAGLIPELSTPDVPLAFYASVGFLAGFNERFAQDMLVGSAKRLEHQAARSSDGDR